MTTSLTRQVADAINRRGNCTAADLLPDLPGCTLRQVIDALHNAKMARLVSLVQKPRALGYRSGWTLGVYGRYVPEPERRRVASVWDLGSCFATQA